MQTDIDFEEKFGINPIPLTQSKSETMGKKPIKEHSYFWWNEGDRKDLLEPGALPNTGIYIQPDTVEDELYYPAFYDIQTRNLSPREYPQFMQQSQAIFELEKRKKEKEKITNPQSQVIKIDPIQSLGKRLKAPRKKQKPTKKLDIHQNATKATKKKMASVFL